MPLQEQTIRFIAHLPLTPQTKQAKLLRARQTQKHSTYTNGMSHQRSGSVAYAEKHTDKKPLSVIFFQPFLSQHELKTRKIAD